MSWPNDSSSEEEEEDEQEGDEQEDEEDEHEEHEEQGEVGSKPPPGSTELEQGKMEQEAKPQR